jgi:hypothetical protein
MLIVLKGSIKYTLTPLTDNENRDISKCYYGKYCPDWFPSSDVEVPTPGMNGTVSTEPDVSIDISPLEPLPINGTVTMSLEDVVDTNMNEIPPQGVTVIISNDVVTVTNHEVTIEEPETETQTEEPETE